MKLARGWGIAPIDYDNDGWIDLVAAAGGDQGAARLIVLRNDQGRFTDATNDVGPRRSR